MPLPLFERHRFCGCHVGNAGAVNCDIHRSSQSLNLADGAKQSATSRHIETRDVCARLGQPDRDTLTDAAARAGDKRILTIQAKSFHTEHQLSSYSTVQKY
jgi:hypothetical protein